MSDLDDLGGVQAMPDPIDALLGADPHTGGNRAAAVLCLAAAAPGGEIVDRSQIVTAITQLVRAGQPSRSWRNRVTTLARTRPALTGLLAAAMLASTGTAAYAAGLPGAAASAADTVLNNLGVTVPGPNAHAGTHPAGNAAATRPTAAGHGSAVSSLARTTTLTGAAKGKAIATLASRGRSGGTAATTTTTPNAQAPTSTPPVPTPNSGGTGTAGTASGGASDTGTADANTASGGHSAGGSGNAPSHP